VHRDLKRTSNISGSTFDNILLTSEGLRLIDVGISAIEEEVTVVLFDKFVEVEKEEMLEFKEFFLNR
jgi:serine/threonine protein kinase